MVNLNKHTLFKIILKTLEIVCVITAISLTTGHHFFVDEFRGASFFTDGTLMLAIILTPILLFFDVFGDSKSHIFEAIVTFVLAVFMLATGSIGIRFWNFDNSSSSIRPTVLPKARGLGSMCIVGGFFYLIDAMYSVVIFKTGCS